MRANREYGAWHLLENSTTRFALQKTGWHPWVLVQPSDDTRPFSIAVPRSTTADEGIRHPPHTRPAHGCRIVEPGRLVVLEKRSLTRETIVAADVECIEPDPDALKALLKGKRR